MDPKAYLPLLEGFEAIGNQGDGGRGSYEHWVMHMAVGLHLQRHEIVIESGIKALSLGRQQHKALDIGDNGSMVEVMSPADVATEIISATKQAGRYALTLPLLQSAVAATGKDKDKDKNMPELLSVLSSIRYDYAVYLKKAA